MKVLGAVAGLLGAAWLGAWMANAGPFGIDKGVARQDAYAVNIGLLALFGVQHSLMARPFWKRLWSGVPERAMYLIFTTAALAVLFVFWRPLPGLVWELASWLRIGQALGGLLALWAVKELNARAFLGLQPQPAALCRTGPYRWMRHPILIGTLALLWCVPRMTEGHLLFSAGMTVYGLVGTWLETRDLATRRV